MKWNDRSSYDDVRRLFLSGEISVDEWKQFCMDYLVRLYRDQGIIDVVGELTKQGLTHNNDSIDYFGKD
jgi:hypothetical protein